MTAREHPADLPAEFVRAVAGIRAARLRPEVVVEETPAPQRLAPHSVAITADVIVDGEEVATGRLVLLHDPVGHDVWQGTSRLVTFARAELDHDMAADPMLTAVGWSWLVEALEARGAGFTAAAGTVTRTSSESFGEMADKAPEAQLEVRASWTPATTALAAHVEAWTDLLCTAAGLPPLPAGVATLAGARGGRGTRPRS